MNTKVKTSAVATVLLMVLFMFDSSVRGQEPTPTPSRSASEPVADKAKNEEAKDQADKTGAAKAEADNPSPEAVAQPAQAPAAAANPAPAREPGLGDRVEMTGNWGGIRSRWKDKGFELDISLTQFYQSVAAGGISTGSEYNGTFQTEFKFDFGKMFGWKFWLAEIKTETRFGGPLLGGTGTINPVNTAAHHPWR
jgi:hypothetical protein